MTSLPITAEQIVEKNLEMSARMAYMLALDESEQESLEDSVYLIGE